MGRLLAFVFQRRGWQVTLIDADTAAGTASAGWVAAGMLAPYAELDSAEPLVFELGRRSLELWPQWLAELAQPVFYQHNVMPASQTLAQTLDDWGYQGERFAVALNGEFIPRECYEQTWLNEGDQLVLFTPIYGG